MRYQQCSVRNIKSNFVDAAVKALGETPLLEFKLENPPVAGATTTTCSAKGAYLVTFNFGKD